MRELPKHCYSDDLSIDISESVQVAKIMMLLTQERICITVIDMNACDMSAV